MEARGIDRIENMLKEIPFFEEFTGEEVGYFAHQLSLRSFPGDTVLFNQGDVGDFLFFVIEGQVDVSLESPNSKRVIASYQWGNCVGEMSLVDDYPRSATVIVTEPSELLILTKTRFNAILEDKPLIGNKILKGLARNLSMRLRGVTGRFADLA